MPITTRKGETNEKFGTKHLNSDIIDVIVSEVSLMKILLVSPPSASAVKEVLGVSSPPLGLAYIASLLESEGEDVRIIDSITENYTLEKIDKEMEKWGPDIVGVTSVTPTFYDAIKVAKIAKMHGAITVLGGAHVTFMARETLEKYPFVDFVVRGEGEYTMLQLVHCIEKGEEPHKILGLSYRSRSGIVKENPPRPPIMNLDELPPPAYHLLPMDKYRFQGLKYATMITSRGCPFRCVFCASSRICGKKWRGLSPERVVDEMEYLINEYGVRDIEFLDDTFTFDKKRALQICDLIAKRGLDVRWICSSRVDIFDKELAQALKKSGCEIVYFGVESGSQRVLNAMKKGITLKQAIRAVKNAKEAGLKNVASFILGMPDETIDEANMTINFAIKLNPDYAQFTICTPFPGTELYEYAVRNNLLLTRDWSKYNTLTPVMKTKIGVRTLKKLLSKAYLKFYTRIRYIIERIKNREFVIVKNAIRGVLNYLRNYFYA